MQTGECKFKSPEHTLKATCSCTLVCNENVRRGGEMGDRDRRTTELGPVSVRDSVRVAYVREQ